MLSVLFVSFVAAGCEPRPGPPSSPRDSAPPAPSGTVDGEESAPSVPAPLVTKAQLDGDFACGPFHTSSLAAAPRTLLKGRLDVRFLEGTESTGATAGKIESTNGELKVFVGARETFLRADASFERRAASTALFDGGFDPVTIMGRDGKLRIVAGVYRDAKVQGEMVPLAHGWFVDPRGDVLDIAVFVSPRALVDVSQCRLFAEKVLSTVANGSRSLDPVPHDEVTTPVSFAQFHYNPGGQWALLNADGIHDFAHMRFTRRGVFPDGGAELALGLDSAPGDWSSPGKSDGSRPGKLLGATIQWHLTRHEHGYGAWTIGDGKQRDNPVARIIAGSERARDEAITFAESVSAR